MYIQLFLLPEKNNQQNISGLNVRINQQFTGKAETNLYVNSHWDIRTVFIHKCRETIIFIECHYTQETEDNRNQKSEVICFRNFKKGYCKHTIPVIRLKSTCSLHTVRIVKIFFKKIIIL